MEIIFLIDYMEYPALGTAIEVPPTGTKCLVPFNSFRGVEPGLFWYFGFTNLKAQFSTPPTITISTVSTMVNNNKSTSHNDKNNIPGIPPYYGRVKRLHIRNNKNKKIDAMLIYANKDHMDESVRNRPTVLFCNPNAGYYECFSLSSNGSSWVHFYTNVLKLNICVFNYSGYGDSEGTPDPNQVKQDGLAVAKKLLNDSPDDDDIADNNGSISRTKGVEEDVDDVEHNRKLSILSSEDMSNETKNGCDDDEDDIEVGRPGGGKNDRGYCQIQPNTAPVSTLRLSASDYTSKQRRAKFRKPYATSLIIHGESIGGLVACYVASEIMKLDTMSSSCLFSNKVKLLICDRTFGSLDAVARRMLGNWAGTLLRLFGRWKTSNVDDFLNCPCPKLVVQVN